MPSNLFVCAKNVFDLDHCEMASTPTLASSLPMPNLRLSSRGRVARTVGNPASVEYRFSWGGAGNYMNYFSWYRHNLEPGCTGRLIIYPNADFTGVPLYDNGPGVSVYPAYMLGDYGAEFGFLPLGYSQAVYYAQPRFTTYFFTRVAALSARYTVTNPGVSDGYLDVSRVHGGDGVELQLNYDSVAVGFKDDGKLTASSGGSPRVDTNSQYRVMSMNVPWIDASQRAAILDMQRYAGTGKDVFVSAYPAATGELRRDHEMIAKTVEAKDIELPKGNPYGVYATAFKFREI